MGPGKLTMPWSVSTLLLELAFLRVALPLAWIIVAMRVYFVVGLTNFCESMLLASPHSYLLIPFKLQHNKLDWLSVDYFEGNNTPLTISVVDTTGK
jgi:hypothetical protein